ncbi:hypothetical protein [Deinococcus arenicola]|uniref:CopG family transcriptional regulator n=1 Tax=Deinococcus arenicola TaxID=2994950 RepID=A0ABU4DUK3_9DEIO|nr:hypothetical protein [Deinococcus sp. ZS9-10]MDV6376091.1 hypothetical protein [Deinococcus sp. ZS9-10]
MTGGYLIPFTPSPEREREELCEQHASLTAYIAREGPEMRASGQHDALGELETIEAAQWARLRELGSAGGQG